MNFLKRTAQPAVQDRAAVPVPWKTATSVVPEGTTTTLEGLIAEDPFKPEDGDVGGDGIDVISNGSASNQVQFVEGHSDVDGDEGWISIPRRGIPENWSDAPDISSFRSSDRSFVFPGEQIHILACLSASKQDSEILTPFRVAAMMSKNSVGTPSNEQNEIVGNKSDSAAERGGENTLHHNSASKCTEENSETNTQTVISASETLLRKESQKKRTEAQLAKFKSSHFFVRIAESDNQLWSKRTASEMSSLSSDSAKEKFSPYEGAREGSNIDGHFTGFIDRGNMDASLSSGVARNSVQCCSLSNGDIVVLLQVNVGVCSLIDPVLEVLQFERYQDQNSICANSDNLAYSNHADPCRELLKWLLPLDRTLPPPARLLSSPSFSSSTSIGSSSRKSNFSASSGSHLFSNFRSYSMSSLPQNSTPPLPQNSTPPPSVTASDSKPVFDIEDWDSLLPQKSLKGDKAQKGGLLSFRGVSLEPERFSVHCGLGGINTPGKRWRRKIEIICPVEVHSFAAECNTEDLLCVQIKNVSPDHRADVVIFIDAVSIVFEESPEDGPPLSLPLPCIEAGSDHCLPNLALRRGEEHSFILRPTTSMWNNPKVNSERNHQPSHLPAGASSLYLPCKTSEGKRITSRTDRYAVLVSYRCNYSESRLFFKQRTGWHPRIVKDLMLSVSSEMSEQILESKGGVSKLPVQVLTLQASNLTSEDLTLTVLAPASIASPPTMVSLYSVPSTSTAPFAGFSELAGRWSGKSYSTGVQKQSSDPLVSDTHNENDGAGERSVSLCKQAGSISDVIPSIGLGSTHLWLQSMVPLGRVPSQSAATVKIELLPLTDGIITLDTLQIDVKEKGLTYIPQHCLKINATSSIAAGIS